MSGYLHGIDATGCEPIDAVLWAVIAAGDAYHHTDGWIDPGYDGGPSEIEQINAIATRSANIVVGIQAENARLRAALNKAREYVRDCVITSNVPGNRPSTVLAKIDAALAPAADITNQGASDARG